MFEQEYNHLNLHLRKILIVFYIKDILAVGAKGVYIVGLLISLYNIKSNPSIHICIA